MIRFVKLMFALAVLVWAQRSRDDYHAAYRSWRETDPNLEREAGSLFANGGTAAQRADRMAEQASKYAAARKAFLEAETGDAAQQILWLETARPAVADPPTLPIKTELDLVAAETAAVVRQSEVFAGDADRGLQQLHTALLREKSALDMLNIAVQEGKTKSDVAAASVEVAEQARAKTLEPAHALLAAWKRAEDDTARESAAWAEYYRLLATPPAATQAAPSKPAERSASGTSPGAATETPSDAKVPVVRYTGAWTYPQANAVYHGLQPEFVDLLVHEENGRVTGTLVARFKLPPGDGSDPMVRFDFSGELQSTRNQVFPLVTSDGTKGAVELIPGSAFNLLEVNFQIDLKPGKVHTGNVVLLKK